MDTPVANQNGPADEYSTPIPQGASTGAQQGSPQDEYSTPIPSGASISTSPQSGAPEGQHFMSANLNPASDLIQHQPGEGATMHGLRNLGGVAEGVSEGAAGTLAGTYDAVNKYTGHHLPQSVSDTLHAAAGQGSGGQADQSHQIGYGGQSLTEFLMGDEALKALGWSDRLIKSGQIAKTLESSPKLIQALKIGSDAMRAGVVQGTQTLLHTGGDLDQAATDAAKMAGTAGVLGAATGAAGSVLGGIGETADRTQTLAQSAGDAAPKEDVANWLSQKITDAEDDLHTNYQEKVTDFSNRLKDQQTPYEGSPLHQAAQSMSATAADETKPLDAAFNQTRPGSKGVNNMIDMLANPNAEEEEAAQPEKWTDANGVDHVEPAAVAEPKPPINLGIDELIERRQQLGEKMRNTDTLTAEGRADKQAYRTLIGGVDDTIDRLAKQSQDPDVATEYSALRSNYKDKIGLFDDPLIKKLQEGKADDAAKNFVGTINQSSALPSAGQVRYNMDNLRNVIGDQGVKDFGQQVFGTIMKDSVDGSGTTARFNPAKFMKTWGRINDETKGDLFGLDPSGANKTPVMPKGSAPASLAQAQQMVQNGQARAYDISQLVDDAQSAASLQHLTRVGILLPAVGAIGDHFGGSVVGTGLGSVLGLIMAEGAGVAKGKALLDYVANHPYAWNTYSWLGKAANSTTAKVAGKLAAVGGGKGVIAATTPDSKKRAYSGAAQALSQ
jgi:hypothetical protein